MYYVTLTQVCSFDNSYVIDFAKYMNSI